jgi:hypothetical protein
VCISRSEKKDRLSSRGDGWLVDFFDQMGGQSV